MYVKVSKDFTVIHDDTPCESPFATNELQWIQDPSSFNANKMGSQLFAKEKELLMVLYQMKLHVNLKNFTWQTFWMSVKQELPKLYIKQCCLCFILP